MFPGMPDVLKKKPPKAGEDWEARTLDEAIARSHELLDEAIARYSTDGCEIMEIDGLFSGGNDSVVFAHLLRDRFDGILHVNTGTAIDETTEHVRDVVAAWGLPLHEVSPKDRYRDLVLGRVLAMRGKNKGRPVWIGFPGPGGDSHRVMYRRLKDEPLQRYRRSLVGLFGRRRKVLYIAGMRWAESDPRFRNASEIDPDGAIIWVSPIVHWTDAHMREYRARHRCHLDHEHALHRMCTPDALPLNEVTEHLHMSGDCTCGCFARKGELDEITMFYPEHAARIRALEAEVEAAGIPACRWGKRPPGSEERRKRRRRRGRGKEPMPRLCAGCAPPIPGQVDLMELWRRQGLISDAQYEALTVHGHGDASEELQADRDESHLPLIKARLSKPIQPTRGEAS